VQRSRGAQTPWESSSLTGDFIFNLTVNVSPPAAGASAGFDQRQLELAFWETIKSSTDANDFQDYLAHYPQGEFRSLAERRLQALRPAATQSATIKGVVVTYSEDGWPVIDGQILRLSGIEPVPRERMRRFVTWLTRQAGYLECKVKPGDMYRCLTRQSEDLAQALLMTGEARTSSDADDVYLAAQSQARQARKGIWR
jgi:hypothetical protein